MNQLGRVGNMMSDNTVVRRHQWTKDVHTMLNHLNNTTWTEYTVDFLSLGKCVMSIRYLDHATYFEQYSPLRTRYQRVREPRHDGGQHRPCSQEYPCPDCSSGQSQTHRRQRATWSSSWEISSALNGFYDPHGDDTHKLPCNHVMRLAIPDGRSDRGSCTSTRSNPT